MARRRVLLAVGALATLVVLATADASLANEVDWVSAQNTTSGTEVEAGDSGASPGTGPGNGQSPEAEEDDEDEPTDIGVRINPIDLVLGVQPDFCSPVNLGAGDCAGNPTTPPEEPEEPAAPVVVTLRDIASFRPATPGNGMEPGGWAIEGLPANFVAAASVEVVSGTLLGQPADVRFTPVGYRWAHSDGAAVESVAPGATWASLGQREFTPTSTSHIYATAGEYTVELAVVLRAEYRFGGSAWRSIAGTLSVAGEPQRVLVGEVDTVLTQGDCNTNPSGPGC